MSTTTRTRIFLNAQSQAILRNVIDFCKKEAGSKDLAIPLTKWLERAAVCTGITQRTLQRVNSSNFTKKRPRRKRKDSIVVDNFDLSVIRRTIANLYEQNVLPTVRRIHAELQQNIKFKWSREVLRKIILNLGFSWKKCASSRKLLLERKDIVMLRIKYLREIKRLREAGHPIVYMDETFVNSSHTVPKCWQMDGLGLHVPFGKGERLIIVNAGSEKGFIPNASLCFKAGSSSGDYHNEMNSNNYQKWLTEKRIPNLEHNTVLVIDNAPYHNVQEEKRPNSSSKKADMQDWLTKKGVAFDANMLRPQLLQLCKEQNVEPKFRVDALMRQHGHQVLRLPPYHADLNPIELIWAELKNHVAKNNLKFRMADVKALVGSKMACITENEWSKCVENVKTVEHKYWESDIAIERDIDSVIINLNDSTEDEETDTCAEESEISTLSGSDTTESVDTSTDTAEEIFTVVSFK